MLAATRFSRPAAFSSACRTNGVPSRIARAPVVARRAPLVVCQAAQALEIEADVVASESPAVKEGICHLRQQRGSVFKVRRVLDVIRGRTYEDAIIMMEYMPYKACELIVKALKSAAANAKYRYQAAKSKLVVTECYADGGSSLKRFRPRAQGRGFKILKPTFHVTVRVTEVAEAE